MFCLLNTHPGKYLKTKPEFKVAQQRCFPHIQQTQQKCGITEEELHRVFVDSTQGHKLVKNKQFSTDEQRYISAKKEMLTRCDRCIASHAQAYTPVLDPSHSSTLNGDSVPEIVEARNSLVRSHPIFSSCSAKDLEMFCLESTHPARFFRNTLSYKTAEGSCVQNIVKPQVAHTSPTSHTPPKPPT